MKAQAAVEYLTIIAVAIAILIPIIIRANDMLISYKENTKISIAANTVKKIGEAANWVFSQGPPARHTTKIYVPDGVEEASIENNIVLYRIKTSAGTSTVDYDTTSPLNGSIPTSSGYYKITLTAFENYVNISW